MVSFDIIEKMKKSALDRCKDRLIEAQNKASKIINNVKDNEGITSNLKRKRGL